MTNRIREINQILNISLSTLTKAEMRKLLKLIRIKIKLELDDETIMDTKRTTTKTSQD